MKSLGHPGRYHLFTLGLPRAQALSKWRRALVQVPIRQPAKVRCLSLDVSPIQ